jgi:hypothetical protein
LSTRFEIARSSSERYGRMISSPIEFEPVVCRREALSRRSFPAVARISLAIRGLRASRRTMLAPRSDVMRNHFVSGAWNSIRPSIWAATSSEEHGSLI